MFVTDKKTLAREREREEGVRERERGGRGPEEWRDTKTEIKKKKKLVIG